MSVGQSDDLQTLSTSRSRLGISATKKKKGTVRTKKISVVEEDPKYKGLLEEK